MTMTTMAIKNTKEPVRWWSTEALNSHIWVLVCFLLLSIFPTRLRYYTVLQ